MTPRYADPAAFRQALEAKARAAARADAAAAGLEGREAGDYAGERMQWYVRNAAMHALLVRLAAGVQGEWVVKGGFALQLRLDPNRPSKDLDVQWVARTGDRAISLDELRDAAESPREDFMRFVLDLRAAQTGEDRSVEIPVRVDLAGRELIRFGIDVAPEREDVQAGEAIHRTAPLGIEQLGEVDVPLLAVEAQVAQKACAMHEVRGHDGRWSSRWRDLADIAMIAMQLDGLDASVVASELAAEVDRRGDTLPTGLPDRLVLPDGQLDEWRESWGDKGRAVPITLDKSIERARQLLDPVLSGEVTCGSWHSDSRAWIG